MIREAFKDLNRLREIAVIVTRHGFGHYLDRARLWDVLGRREPIPEGAAPPEGKATASRFRQMLLDLGPTFIKLGQVLSSRPDMLPAVWVDELSQLQDSVPPFPLADVRAEIERALGDPVEKLFADLDPTPLASASIAQVHRARTNDGQEVVVKVQRPRIRQRIESDLALLYYLARLLEAVIEETGIYTPTGIVEEFDRSIHEELDFLNEARNAEEMREKSKGRDYLLIPEIHRSLCAPTVLTMQFVAGVKVSEITPEAGYDPKQVAKNIIEASFRQLFDDGLFHGDPHPGNVLVLPGNRIALLDFGLVGRLTRQMQDTIVLLSMAIALKDPDTLARLLYRVGVPEGRTDLSGFRADIQAIFDRYLGLSLKEIHAETLLRDMIDLAVKHRIKVPKEYAILSKASLTVEGIVRRLYPDMNVAEMAAPYAKDLLLARFNPLDAQGGVFKSLLKLQSLTEELPAQLSQILMDLEGGKFRVNVQGPQLDRVAANVRNLSLTVFLGMITSALIIGGTFVLSRYDLVWHGLPVVAVLALVLAGFFFGWAFTWYLVAGRLKKISIQRWLRR